MRLLPSDDHRARIDGSALEKLVYEYISEAGQGLANFRVEHRELVTAPDGQYQIDVTARFQQLGVDFLVLVECKDHTRPVEREEVQILSDKMRATGAQKAILFSTNGFQRGALDYAKVHRVALVRILEGRFTHETKSLGGNLSHAMPPPWANFPPFVGQYLEVDGHNICVSLVEHGRPDSIAEYLRSA